MKKVGLIALREFMAAVANRGFLIGLLMMPVLGRDPRHYRPLPRTAAVWSSCAGGARPDRRSRSDRQSSEVSCGPCSIRWRSPPNGRIERATARGRRSGGGASCRVEQAIESAVGPQPEFRIVEHPATGDLQEEKAWLTQDAPDDRHLAVVAIHPDAVVAAAGAPLGGYDVYVPANLTLAIEDVIHEGAAGSHRQRTRAGRRIVDRDRLQATDARRQTGVGDRHQQDGEQRSVTRVQHRAADGVRRASGFWA